MAATMTTMAMINAKCFNTNTKGTFNPSKKSISPLSMQNHPRGLTTTSKPLEVSGLAGTALAGVIFSTLCSSDAAFDAQQIADIAEADNRGLALRLPIIPAIAWVLYPSKKSISPLSMQNHPRGLTTTSKPLEVSGLAGTALAGVIFSTLCSSDAAFAAQQIADIAEADNRGLALPLPIIPAIAWVLYNILQPALNQINKMSVKGVIIGLGLGGLVGSSFVRPPESSASEISMIADAAADDNRGQLLLFVVTPAILWVLYNILQPALNQINRMRSD